MIPIGRAVRYYRDEKRWTMQFLATKVGCPRTYISRVENGVLLPGLMQIFRLAAALEIDPDLLVRYAYRITVAVKAEYTKAGIGLDTEALTFSEAGAFSAQHQD